ncbi:MAG: acetyl ornithine aminotransferase family protein [Bryobacterales bacterium]|nr:acetyl ornithine aminotransferase family protein [Bryobacterales bacterium]
MRNLPELITPLPGPKAQAIIARDHAAVSGSYTRCYPLVAERGEGATVIDVDGNRFLDCNAGIAVVATGHCHPRIVQAIEQQARKLIHMSGTDFYYENMVTLAEKLSVLAPMPGPHRTYFGNSGTEAIEAAMKIARYHSGRDKFIAFLGGFHGRTMGSLSLTASKYTQRARFSPLVPGVTHIPYAYCYRCPYHQTPDTCTVECVDILEAQLFKTILPADEVAAIVLEPMQGEGGYVVPPPKFFAELQRVAEKHGILLIADEVQCGMGRTGRMWASQHFDFKPDILAIAKGISSGLPLSATVARADVMDWKPGAHASTFGGNPVAVAAALTTIELLEQELIENARQIGEHLMARLKEWPKRFPQVGDVRGLGLMIGIEIVKNQTTREPDQRRRNALIDAAFHSGILILGAGENTIRLSPPLTFTLEQADFVASTLEQLLARQP